MIFTAIYLNRETANILRMQILKNKSSKKEKALWITEKKQLMNSLASEGQNIKLKEIRNSRDEKLAVLIENNPLSIKTESIIDLIKKYAIVIWKQTKLTLKEYYHWQLQLGYHQYGHIWCNHKTYPIFDRVTNKMIDDRQTGLFGEGSINWHTDQVFNPDAEELLSLFGVTTPPGTITQFANSTAYWKSKDCNTKNKWNKLQIAVTNKTKKTYEKKGSPHYKLPILQQNDFDKRRRSRDVRKSLNFPEKFYHLYLPPRCEKKSFRRLVPDHSLEIKGVYFPHFNISYIADNNGTALPDSRALYDKIKKEYIESGRYLYTHRWNEGDIVLSDQQVTVHRQEDAYEQRKLSSEKIIIRELYKSNCWYKTQYRKHFRRSL